MISLINRFPLINSSKNVYSCLRYFSGTEIRHESALATLRKKTGYALNLCKKALEENRQDVKLAEDWLKEEAARHGWAKASKLQNRPTAQGLVGVVVDKNSCKGVLLEVNCETDFVARTDKFRDLVSKLTSTVASATVVPGKVSNNDVSPQPSLLNKFSMETDHLDPFKEQVVTAISQLGENIILKRALILQPRSTEPPVELTAYAHSVGGASNVHEGVYLGKYATLLAYTSGAEEDEKEENIKTSSGHAQREVTEEGVDMVEEDALERESFDTRDVSQEHLSRLICQHIVGYKPIKVRSTPEERQQSAKLKEIRKKAGTFDDGEEDSDVLLDQRFLLDNKVTVRQLLKEKDMRVLDFIRFECGVNDDA